MKKYDIILIECEFYKKPHYENIIGHIADLLTTSGMKIAVINYLQNNTFHDGKGYDVIAIDINKKLPPVVRDKIEKKDKITKILMEIWYSLRYYKYFNKIFSEILNYSDSIYLGSFSPWSLPVLINLKLRDKKIFIWGAYNQSLERRHRNPIKTIKSFLLRFLIKKQNLFFITPSLLTKNILKDKVCAENKIIIKPEMTYKDVCTKTCNNINSDFLLSTITEVRGGKNIHFALDALKNMQIKYTVAGRSWGEYGKMLDDLIENMDEKYFTRVTKWLSNDEMKNLYKKTHFILLNYREPKYVRSYGTLFMAIKYYRPIIAPNYDPFKYCINKYNIGIKYEPNDKESLINAINEAKEKGTQFFSAGINYFRKDFEYHKVAKEFSNSMKKTNNL